MKFKVKVNNNLSENDVKNMMRKLRGKTSDKLNGKNLSIRDTLKITRSLNEQEEETKSKEDKKTIYDEEKEKEKFLEYVDDLNVNVKFSELFVYDDSVIWGGIIDGIIMFVYTVTPNDTTSGVEINYTNDFSPDNPKNDEIVEKIESYYDTFYDYWSDNVTQD
ncbi:MAG: hypothetical protein ACOC2W_04260 [bacterium]